jgi:transaldolase
VAQAQQAYQHFLRAFSGPRWEALAAKGAQVQRPLWASTSTKNPAYPDLLYVDSPDRAGHRQHDARGDARRLPRPRHPARTVDADPAAARRLLARPGEVGIDMADVATTLEDEGVASFAKSFDELIQSLTDKAAALGHDRA